MKQPPCQYCSSLPRNKAEYEVNISEWDENGKDFINHPDTVYVCLKHFEEFGAQLP